MTGSVWMFGGQGSQYYQMGRDLFAADPVFRRTVQQCSDVVEGLIGESLVDVIYRERRERFAAFDQLLTSSPAICAVQIAAAAALRARGCEPDKVLGYSLGTISAEVVAGALSLEDGLRVAVRLAQLSEARLAPGGMLAVLAPHEAYADTWTAARNFANHFVVTGALQPLDRVEAQLRDRGVTLQRLPVRYAFHCPLVEPIASEFSAFVSSRPVRQPRIPIVGRTSLWDAVRRPVDFAAVIAQLEASGGHCYVDLGPAGTLATFAKYSLLPNSRSTIVSTLTPFDCGLRNMDRFAAAIHAQRSNGSG